MNWTVYLLHHKEAGKTYIGATTDVHRRIRQHNCELAGGAKLTTASTKKYNTPWRIICYLEGFSNQSSAYRWEKLLKLHHRGLQKRHQAFSLLSSGTFTKKSKDVSEEYQPPENLRLYTPE